MRCFEFSEQARNGVDGAEDLGVLEDKGERGVGVGPSTAADQREQACDEEKERLRDRTGPLIYSALASRLRRSARTAALSPEAGERDSESFSPRGKGYKMILPPWSLR